MDISAAGANARLAFSAVPAGLGCLISDLEIGPSLISTIIYRSCERPDKPISCLSASRMTADFFLSLFFGRL